MFAPRWCARERCAGNIACVCTGAETTALHGPAGSQPCTSAHFAPLHPGIRARARLSHAPARFLRLCIPGIAGVHVPTMQRRRFPPPASRNRGAASLRRPSAAHRRAFCAPASPESQVCIPLRCNVEDSRRPRHEIAALHRFAAPPPRAAAHFALLHPGIREYVCPRCAPTHFPRPCIPRIAALHAPAAHARRFPPAMLRNRGAASVRRIAAAHQRAFRVPAPLLAPRRPPCSHRARKRARGFSPRARRLGGGARRPPPLCRRYARASSSCCRT